MKTIKLYAWEPAFEKLLKRIRDQELNKLRKCALSVVFSVDLAWACGWPIVRKIFWQISSRAENVFL
jgi:hypothetical protein